MLYLQAFLINQHYFFQFITEDIKLDTPEIRAMLDFLGIKALWHQAGTKTA